MYPITNKVRSFHGSQFENGCQRLGNPGSESKQHTTENKMESAMLVAFRQTTMNIIPSWSTALGPPWNCNQRLAHRAPLDGGWMWASSRGICGPCYRRTKTNLTFCYACYAPNSDAEIKLFASRHTRYRPATTTRNTATQRMMLTCDLRFVTRIICYHANPIAPLRGRR